HLLRPLALPAHRAVRRRRATRLSALGVAPAPPPEALPTLTPGRSGVITPRPASNRRFRRATSAPYSAANARPTTPGANPRRGDSFTGALWLGGRRGERGGGGERKAGQRESETARQGGGGGGAAAGGAAGAAG